MLCYPCSREQGIPSVIHPELLSTKVYESCWDEFRVFFRYHPSLELKSLPSVQTGSILQLEILNLTVKCFQYEQSFQSRGGPKPVLEFLVFCTSLKPEIVLSDITCFVAVLCTEYNVITQQTHYCCMQLTVNAQRVSHIPFARHYNPRFVYFLPHFSVRFIIKSS